MTRRKRLLVLGGFALALALAAVLLVPACRWRVVGWQRHESFYRGLPSSYWAREVNYYYQFDTGRLAGSRLEILIARLSPTLAPHDPFSNPEPAAIPVLVELLHDPRPCVRWSASFHLGEIGEEAKPAVPALLDSLRDDHYLVRGNAHWALWKIGAAPELVYPALLDAVRDELSAADRH